MKLGASIATSFIFFSVVQSACGFQALGDNSDLSASSGDGGADLSLNDLLLNDLLLDDLAGQPIDHGLLDDLSTPDDALSQTDFSSATGDMLAPSTWTTLSSGVTNNLRGVSGISGDVFVVGAGGVILESTDQGSNWNSVTNPSGIGPLYAAFQVPGGKAFAVGDNADILQAQSGAGTFSKDTAPNYGFLLTGVWGTSNALFAVGFARASSNTEFGILRSSGNGTWTEVSPMIGGGAVKAEAVWGPSDTDVYVVGEAGTIEHTINSGTSWQALTSNISSTLYAVWGASLGAVYAVGAGGTILFSTGGGDWVTQSSGVTTDLRGVWGAGGSVWAVGLSGTILRKDGNGSWTPESFSNDDYYAIWGSTGSDVYVVGSGGVILHKP